MNIGYLTPALAVSGALNANDFADLAKLGFGTVISNRPDGEEAGQLTARDEAVLAWRSGLVFKHVPAAKHEVLEAHVIDALEAALTSVPGPVLLHCKSGLRSAIAWAAVAVRAGSPVEEVIAAAEVAGFDLETVRDEIQDLAAQRGAPTLERAAA
jgi:uncharacterized protein (TIGR01244 family)